MEQNSYEKWATQLTRSLLIRIFLWYKLSTLPCACCGHCVLSQHSLIWLQSSDSDALGLGQGGSIEAGPPCERRFKTTPHAAWWGSCFRSGTCLITGRRKSTHRVGFCYLKDYRFKLKTSDDLFCYQREFNEKMGDLRLPFHKGSTYSPLILESVN